MNSRDRNRNKLNNIAMKFGINKNKQLTRGSLRISVQCGCRVMFFVAIFMASIF